MADTAGMPGELTRGHSSNGAAHSYLENTGKHKGILAWILSTDHKRIGILYMISIFSFFAVGVALGFLMRLEMLVPGPTGKIFNAQEYNALFTLHGVIMIFLFVIPGIPATLGNFFLPIQIGAKDVAFPRLNLLSWYLYVTGAIVILLSLFWHGMPDTGWTFYVPYSIRTGTDVTMAVFGVFILGFSSILTGLNFLTTIHRLRAPGMTFFKMPLFVWSLYATAWIQVIATPVLAITLLLIIIERVFSVGIFNPTMGGDPVLYQHLFWIYSHPAVYIMILPPMGVVSEIVATFSHRTIFGYKMVAMSSLAIAFIGYLVWGHHMFVAGETQTAQFVFSLLTFLVAVPSGIKVFNWIATMYKGSIDPQPPFLFLMAFIILFAIGGLTGLVLGSLATDVHLTGTYFVVGHFHYIIFGGAVFIFFGALHYWLPKMFGRMYNKKVSVWALGILFVGFNMLYFPMLLLGYEGMPRRYFAYLPKYETLQHISMVGSWVLILGLIIMFWNLLHGIFRGEKCGDNPWGGTTLEWTVSSPPPAENFEEIPVVTNEPYYHPEAIEMKPEPVAAAK